MPMALMYFAYPVHFLGQSSLSKHAGIGPQPHCSTLVIDRLLVRHQMNDGIGGSLVEFGAVCASQFGDIPRKLDRCALHAQAQAKKRNLVFPGVSNRSDFPFDTTRAESARNQDTIDLT